MEVVLFFVLVILTIGLIIRPLGTDSMLFTGAILVGVGIAIANVLMPAFIKMKFANNLGVMTGVYSLSMNITGALAAGLVFLLQHPVILGGKDLLEYGRLYRSLHLFYGFHNSLNEKMRRMKA